MTSGRVVIVTGANNGIGLAKKIGSPRPVVTPGFAETIGVLASKLVPGSMGKFMSAGAAAASENA